MRQVKEITKEPHIANPDLGEPLAFQGFDKIAVPFEDSVQWAGLENG